MAVVTRILLIMYLLMSVSIILSSSDFLFDIKLLDQTQPSEIKTNLLSPNSSPINNAFDSNNETIFHSNYLSNSGDIYLSYKNKKVMNNLIKVCFSLFIHLIHFTANFVIRNVETFQIAFNFSKYIFITSFCKICFYN